MSNSVLGGFTITDGEGNKTDYIVVNGIVDYADGRSDSSLISSVAGSSLSLIQTLYDQLGDTDSVIRRVNSVGIGTAKMLSDNDAYTIAQKAKSDRLASLNQLMTGVYKRKKGVNRHGAFWSAM